MNECTVEVGDIFGHVVLRTWFEPGRDANGEPVLVGMGESLRYDRDGNLLEVKRAPSGVVARWG